MHNSLIHKINRQIAEALPYRGRVVDMGCGTAPYKDIILRKASEYVGVDWKNSMHDQSNVDVFADLSTHVPLEDGYADTVVSFQVMEHLAEPRRFLTECYRILKPGGPIFITVPFMWQVHEAPHDYYRYTRYGLEYLLRSTGFSEINVTANTGFWQMWILKFNYYTKRFARGPLKLVLVPIWWVDQRLAPLLDRLDPREEEAATYTATARRPD